MKKKIAVGVASLGVIFVASSAVLYGTGAAPVFAALDDANLVDSTSIVLPTPAPAAPQVEVLPRDAAATDDQIVDTAPEALSFEGLKASIPAHWSADEVANATVWLEQASIISECLAEVGYTYTFTPFWLIQPGTRPTSWESTLPEAERAAASLALWGNTGGGASYRWEDAGCHGYAVHVTGMDNAN
ncbi:hypothetical protein B0I08_11139 [Glaciihabitans tibetensis]|uniref:Uncharacterized protein n=1 Tax=Glaciihabitans tibetensis TaxID=1266600 RepID=A0A2T0V4C3_9MICO|nr:hypothetical protein [Glaciihabitans tibetensis]PRY65022.1 hypothetical protein B0I08_11139 [Glaciihabitans tibetensis]